MENENNEKDWTFNDLALKLQEANKDGLERLVNSNLRLFEGEINLSQIRCNNKIFTNEIILNKILECSILSYITFVNCKFEKVALTNSYFHTCKFIDCSFHETSLNNSEYYNCVFTNCRIKNSNLSYSDIYDTLFYQCKFEESSFSHIYLEDCFCFKTIFGKKIDYSDSDFTKIELKKTIFFNSKHSIFKRVHIWNSNLTVQANNYDEFIKAIKEGKK